MAAAGNRGVLDNILLLHILLFNFLLFYFWSLFPGTPSLRIGSTLASAVEQSTFQVTED